LGEGLPINGKLLGHSQFQTTQRYAHLDADPVTKASERIALILTAANEAGTLAKGIDSLPVSSASTPLPMRPLDKSVGRTLAATGIKEAPPTWRNERPLN
jgi:hypothetical protein